VGVGNQGLPGVYIHDSMGVWAKVQCDALRIRLSYREDAHFERIKDIVSFLEATLVFEGVRHVDTATYVEPGFLRFRPTAARPACELLGMAAGVPQAMWPVDRVEQLEDGSFLFITHTAGMYHVHADRCYLTDVVPAD